MELLIILIIAAVVGGVVIYRATRASSKALEVLDLNKDGVISAQDAKEAVAVATKAVKKATTAKKPSTKKPAAPKAKAKS
jgi:hypothetical protein